RLLSRRPAVRETDLQIGALDRDRVGERRRVGLRGGRDERDCDDDDAERHGVRLPRRLHRILQRSLGRWTASEQWSCRWTPRDARRRDRDTGAPKIRGASAIRDRRAPTPATVASRIGAGFSLTRDRGMIDWTSAFRGELTMGGRMMRRMLGGLAV